MNRETRCPWFTTSPILEAYHDNEWGVPAHDDKMLFEYLFLEWMSCGLSFKLMLKKRETFRRLFCGFSYKDVAQMDEKEIDAAMKAPDMIHSLPKIKASINNAKRFLSVIDEFGSFDKYIWSFTRGKTIIYREHFGGKWLTRSALSDAIASDMKRRGFAYIGTVTIYSYLQAIGVINDHEKSCPQFSRLAKDAVIADSNFTF